MAGDGMNIAIDPNIIRLGLTDFDSLKLLDMLNDSCQPASSGTFRIRILRDVADVVRDEYVAALRDLTDRSLCNARLLHRLILNWDLISNVTPSKSSTEVHAFLQSRNCDPDSAEGVLIGLVAGADRILAVSHPGVPGGRPRLLLNDSSAIRVLKDFKCKIVTPDRATSLVRSRLWGYRFESKTWTWMRRVGYQARLRHYLKRFTGDFDVLAWKRSSSGALEEIVIVECYACEDSVRGKVKPKKVKQLQKRFDHVSRLKLAQGAKIIGRIVTNAGALERAAERMLNATPFELWRAQLPKDWTHHDAWDFETCNRLR